MTKPEAIRANDPWHWADEKACSISRTTPCIREALLDAVRLGADAERKRPAEVIRARPAVEPGRCETCRWWEVFRRPDKGVCRNRDCDMYSAFPRATFGCVFHKPKEGA